MMTYSTHPPQASLSWDWGGEEKDAPLEMRSVAFWRCAHAAVVVTMTLAVQIGAET